VDLLIPNSNVLQLATIILIAKIKGVSNIYAQGSKNDIHKYTDRRPQYKKFVQ
jgi:7-cyano-7-deazaguanine synthase in queuosine biosynthesis